MNAPKLRLDKWLWYARFFKSRALASDVCKAKKVRINGAHCKKASAAVTVGDVLTFPQANAIRVVEVVALGTRRGPATEAATLYKDMSPEPPRSKKGEAVLNVRNPSREKGMGRPTKSDRRALDRLMEQD